MNKSICPEIAHKATNEELAIRYQQGDKSALSGLYEQNRGLLNNFSYQFYTQKRERLIRCGVTPEDVQQTAFFALELAARSYNPEKGFKFTAFIHFHAQNCFNDLAGQRTAHGRMEPLSLSSSLDEPLGEDESITLSDAVQDPAAEHELQTVEDQVFYRQLHNTVEMALNRLNDQQREVLRCRFYRGKTLQETAETIGVSRERTRQLEGNALRNMRYGKSLRQLRPFMEHINSWAYTGTGFNAWKESGSVQERIIEKLEET